MSNDSPRSLPLAALRAGAEIGVRFDAGPLHYFDARGVAVCAD